MPDLEKRAVTRFGLSLSEFWDSTPRELELLMEQSAYRTEQGMNQARHIMAAIANSVPTKRKKGFAPKDIFVLPLIDGKAKETEEERNASMDIAMAALARANKKKKT